MAKYRVDDLSAALRTVLKSGRPQTSIRRDIDKIKDLHARAMLIPGGHLQKIVWTVEEGYPADSAGYTQWTIRPFYQGYGCDGTTDASIHYIALMICQSLGIDYAAAYVMAYEKTPLQDARQMFHSIASDQSVRDETILPELPPTLEAVSLMMSDLYQINNRSLCEVLTDQLLVKGFDVEDFCHTETQLKADYLASLHRLAAA